MITDISGNVVQHLEYIPFGEVFIDERPSAGSWSTPYKFNAKELDEETGLYYYGARYYDPRTSVWISVDPLAEKYPNVSSYVYCHNNPVNMVDPDGMGDYYTKPGNALGSDGKADKLAYTADSKNKDGSFNNAKQLPINNPELIGKASTVYGESTAYKSSKTEELKTEMYSIASVHEKNKKAYGNTSEQAQIFRSTDAEDRNGTKMEYAVGAVINAVTGGPDYSNGAESSSS